VEKKTHGRKRKKREGKESNDKITKKENGKRSEKGYVASFVSKFRKYTNVNLIVGKRRTRGKELRWLTPKTLSLMRTKRWGYCPSF